MKLEIHTRKNEYNSGCMEISQSKEIYQNVKEVFVPKNEIYTERPKRIFANDEIEDEQKKRKERYETKEKLHKKLVRKMSYTVACAMAVIVITQSAGIGIVEDTVVMGEDAFKDDVIIDEDLVEDNIVMDEDLQEDDIAVNGDLQEDDVVEDEDLQEENVVGDLIKDNVIAAGGSVDADLRFTIQWNDNIKNADDLDAYCIEPGGVMLFFGSPISVAGIMELDVTEPGEEIAIENIVYKDKSQMADGVYTLFVHCYTDNAGENGFKAQIEMDNEVYTFEYVGELKEGDMVNIAEITLENGTFTIKELMEKQPYEE